MKTFQTQTKASKQTKRCNNAKRKHYPTFLYHLIQSSQPYSNHTSTNIEKKFFWFFSLSKIQRFVIPIWPWYPRPVTEQFPDSDFESRPLLMIHSDGLVLEELPFLKMPTYSFLRWFKIAMKNSQKYWESGKPFGLRPKDANVENFLRTSFNWYLSCSRKAYSECARKKDRGRVLGSTNNCVIVIVTK